MPLSDREQQILQDIERQLYEQDPKFARGVAATTLQKHLVRNIRRGIWLFLLGFALLVVFFIRPLLPIGVAAFLLMLVAATFTYQHLRKAGAEQMRALREQAPLANLFGRFEGKFRGMRRRDEP